MVTGIDLVLALSNSGEADELAALLPAIKRQGIPLVAMTGGAQSTLARHADWVLDTRVEREACPLNLAPTASTTAQMAMGDALAVALLDARGFGAEDFARSHPGGAIALGHPLGASGARLATTAVNQLHTLGGRYALCTMCIGVGQGIAVILEKV